MTLNAVSEKYHRHDLFEQTFLFWLYVKNEAMNEQLNILLCIFEIFGLVQRPEKYKENFDVSSEGP